MINTLVDRIFKVTSSWCDFHSDLNYFKVILQKNSFPLNLIDHVVNRYLNFKCSNESTVKKQEHTCRYYKLPFVGTFSLYRQKRLNHAIGRHCKKDTRINLIFTPFKIGSMFSTKDNIPKCLKSNLVYKFVCANCSVSSVGETTRHLTTRITGHLKSDKQSHIFKHINNSEDCKLKCDENCFSVLDSSSSKYQLKIKEALHITWNKPQLNKQVKCFATTICI